MAITSVSTLRPAISDWLDRTDLSSQVDNFIQFSTGYLNDRTDFRLRDMETIVSLAPASGVFTLPADYLHYRKVVLDNGTRHPLNYITPDMADMRYPSRPAGLSCDFTIIGSALRAYPTASDNIELTYWAKIPELSDAAPLNWLLTRRPELYLRLGCAFAAEFIKSDGEAKKQFAMAETIIQQMSDSSSLVYFARAGLARQGVSP
jgi:hypothetical protein